MAKTNREKAVEALLKDPTVRKLLLKPPKTRSDADIKAALAAADIKYDPNDEKTIIDHINNSDWSSIIDIEDDLARGDGDNFPLSG